MTTAERTPSADIDRFPERTVKGGRMKKIASALGAVDFQDNLPKNLARWQIVGDAYRDLLERVEDGGSLDSVTANYNATIRVLYTKICALGWNRSFEEYPELRPMYELVCAQPSSKEDSWPTIVKKVFRMEPIPEFEDAVAEARKVNTNRPSKRIKDRRKPGEGGKKAKSNEIVLDPEWVEKVKNSYFGVEGEILLVKGWMEVGQEDREGHFYGMPPVGVADVVEFNSLVEKSGINLDTLENRKLLVLDDIEKKLKEALAQGQDLMSLPVCSDVLRKKVLESFTRFSDRKSKQYGLWGRIKSQVVRNSVKILAPCLSS